MRPSAITWAICSVVVLASVGEAVAQQRRTPPASTHQKRSAPASKAGEVWVRLPGGSFPMGSTSGEANEKPLRRVTLRAFALLKTEVTLGQYRACVEAGACSVQNLESYQFRGSVPVKSSYCNWNSDRADNHPMNCVDWSQAQAFCRWIGGRLPSEAEWEYAARSGGRAQAYPWGNEVAGCSRAVLNEGGLGCGKKSTWAVCSKFTGHSAQGLCDLAGNVWEWVADCYAGSYAGAPTDHAPRSSCPATSTSQRVFRGGSWCYSTRALRAGFRYGSVPAFRAYDLGLRCARTL